jgi:hypothetical protein
MAEDISSNRVTSNHTENLATLLAPEQGALFDQVGACDSKDLGSPPHARREGSVHFSSETCEWSTPADFFRELNLEFGFELDVCATPANAKCDHYYTKAGRRAEPAMAGHMLVQSPLWQGDKLVGRKSHAGGK